LGGFIVVVVDVGLNGERNVLGEEVFYS